MMSRSPRDVRAELALAEQRRRERRHAAAQDHVERTRHSVVQSRLTALETKMDFAQSALNAMAEKMGIQLTAIGAEAGAKSKHTR
jgi:hypothetical protein